MAMSTREALARLVDLFGPQASWDPTQLYGNLTVSPNGNILMGQTTDDLVHKLQLTGGLKLSGSGIVFPDGSSQSLATSGKNRIINGLPLVTQRASSVVAGTGYTYGGPDRFLCCNTAAQGAFTQSTGSIVAGGITLPAVVQTVNTAVAAFSSSSNWSGIQQLMEGYNVFDLINNQITVSILWNSNVTGTFSCCLVDSNGTHSCVQTFTSTAGVPKVVQLTFPASPNLVIPNSNGGGLYLAIGALSGVSTYITSTFGTWLSGNVGTASTATNWAATVGNFISATLIQVELGPVATSFDRKLYPQALHECQRFYQTFTGTLMCTSSTGNFGGGLVNAKGVPMRLNAPPVTVVNTNSGGGWAGAVTGSVTNFGDAQIWFGASGATVGQYCAYTLTANSEF